MDTVAKRVRSRIMATVRSANTRSTEGKLSARLVAAGISGWRYQAADIPGKPDFVFTRHRIAIFVDGCFWHGCPKCYRRPHSHRAYWDAKLAGNIARDRYVTRQLRRQGWRVVRIWEHELHGRATLENGRRQRAVERIRRALHGRCRTTHGCLGTSSSERG